MKDGLIDRPAQCGFDPGRLECRQGDTASCLTAPQVEAARRIYSPLTNPQTKQEIFPGLQPGSELAWASVAGPEPAREAVEFFKYVVFNDSMWDYRTLTFDRASALADAAAGQIFNVTILI